MVQREKKIPINYSPQEQSRKVFLLHLAALVCPVLCKVKVEFRQEGDGDV